MTSQVLPPSDFPNTDRRSANPMSQLGRQWNHICREAVAPGEIMVALEAAGYNDEAARERYGCLDLLDCAEQLYLRVPYRPNLSALSEGGPVIRAWLPLLRGLTYLLPAAWLPLTAQLWPAASANIGWGAATLFCWGWGQMVAYLGYRALGYGQPGQAAAYLRLCSALGLALTGVIALLVAALLGLPLGATVAVALVTGTYLFSAYALLMYGRVLALFAVSLPAALLGLGLALVPAGVERTQLAAGILAFAVGVPLALTVFLTRRPERPLWPGRSAMTTALGHASYGWSCAVFLTWATLTSVSIAPLQGLAGSLILVPLILSMGVMEWLVERLLARLRSLATATLGLEELIAAGQRALASSLGWYVLALVALHLALVALATQHFPAAHVLGQVTFGVAAMVSAVLLSIDRLKMVVISWLVALGLLALMTLLPLGAFLSPSAIFLLDIEALLFGLLISAAIALYDINTYR